MKHHAPVRSANQRFIDFQLLIDSWIGQQVASYMLHQELVVGHVLVQRANQVITVELGTHQPRITFAAV